MESILCTIYENRGIKNNKYECNIISQINIRRGGKFSIDSGLGCYRLGWIGLRGTGLDWANWAMSTEPIGPTYVSPISEFGNFASL